MRFKTLAAVLIASLLAACGGGGDDPAFRTESVGTEKSAAFKAGLGPQMMVLGRTQISLVSDEGDFVGAGGSYLYNQANSVISVEQSYGRLHVKVRGYQNWDADFVLPSPSTQFLPGTFDRLRRYPNHDPAVGGLNWSGEGRGCNVLLGAMRVNGSEYIRGKLTYIDLDFVQHCERGTPALYGNVRWYASDDTVPPGPQRPVPARLWKPAPEAVPAAGSFVYLESDANDFVGAGKKYLYTQRDANFDVSEDRGRIHVKIDGDESWFADFKAMDILRRVRPGWYPNALRYGNHNPAVGGLDWSGDGRGCNASLGWFAVDEIVFVDGELALLDMRFEQGCGDVASLLGKLRGRIRWDRNDRTQPPGPRRIPDHLWKPPAEAIPAEGNYVYLDSSPGDYIEQGVDSLITEKMDMVVEGRTLLWAAGMGWGEFVAMDSIPRLKRGFYPDLEAAPFHNPAKGGMYWTNHSRGCNVSSGWFAIDHIGYDALGNLVALDMRFAQRCEITQPPLFGAVHWIRKP